LAATVVGAAVASALEAGASVGFEAVRGPDGAQATTLPAAAIAESVRN
jgi:hypothetical protein